MTHSIHRIFSSRAGFHMNPNGGDKTGAGVSNVTCSVPRAPGPWLLHDSATSSGREGWGRGRRPTASPPRGPLLQPMREAGRACLQGAYREGPPEGCREHPHTQAPGSSTALWVLLPPPQSSHPRDGDTATDSGLLTGHAGRDPGECSPITRARNSAAAPRPHPCDPGERASAAQGTSAPRAPGTRLASTRCVPAE